MDKKQHRGVRGYRERRLHLARQVNEVFNSPSGKAVWLELKRYYHERYRVDLTPQELAFKAGQRDVVQWLRELRNLAREAGQSKDNYIELA